MAFDHDSTTDDVLAGIDLTGRRAVVTGASGGLGEETARALAAHGAAVTIAARDAAKAEAAAERIRAGVPAAALEVRALDLADLASVRAFAEGFRADHDALDLLINNAGVMACPLQRTEQGWELQFATNHIGHFLLTCLLVPALRAAPAARIVNLSSTGHQLSGVDIDDPFFEHRPYDKWVAYGQSKSANVLFSVALEKRLAASGVHAYAVHPGGIETDLGRHLEESDVAALLSRAGVTDPEQFRAGFKTVPQGAATSCWAATAAELADRGGIYLEDCSIAAPFDGATFGVGIAPHATDAETAERLWARSEEWVGETFDLA